MAAASLYRANRPTNPLGSRSGGQPGGAGDHDAVRWAARLDQLLQPRQRNRPLASVVALSAEPLAEAVQPMGRPGPEAKRHLTAGGPKLEELPRGGDRDAI